MYGEVLYFLTDTSTVTICAVIKKFEVLHESISDCVPPPVSSDLLDMYNIYRYGTFFKHIKRSADVITVSVISFISRCIVMRDANCEEYVTETPVLYEHNWLLNVVYCI